jgi:signal transduction histidine kinase
MPVTEQKLPLDVALRGISIFADLNDDQLRWFASNADDVLLSTGEFLFQAGAPADALYVLLEGEIQGRRETGTPEPPRYIARAGQVTGYLPYSRMTTFQLAARAGAPTRIARLHKDKFPEMLQRIPELLPRLIGVLSDRIRDFSRADVQREKLMALGKLSAGLAHELNNPASAARRAAEGLREHMRELRGINRKLDDQTLSCGERALLASFEEKTIGRLASLPHMDALAQSDCEEELSLWLNQHNVRNASTVAAGLVEAGLDRGALGELSAKFRDEVLSQVLERLVAAVGAERLTREIENSTGRIAELVRAIKEYTYMDQAAEQEVDLHQGLNSTLTMLKFRLKKGVEVKREYDPTLPRVCAHGSELNQIWTNLIDNAIDAMGGKGELTIRTHKELDSILVQVIDNGPGIPEDLKPHIFEPFFTTKNMGDGTGLGLDTVYRIVRNHHGDVSFDSVPGRTAFNVRLPLKTK